MKYFLVLVFVMLSSSIFAQTWARATYSANGKMVEISDLQGLQSCRVTALSGKVTKIDRSDLAAMVMIKQNKERLIFQIPLSRVQPDDRKPLFGHLVTKGNTLEVAGYHCVGSTQPSAISIRRVY